MKELLLNERWRPKNLDDMILLPRIRKIFEKGLKQNVILHGHFGTGKTTLARILIGKWSKNKAFLEINSSFYTSIDVLRTKIDDFCSNVYMNLDLMSDDDIDTMKYVFLDEFERTSIQYQDALKAYIEEFSTKNVRFILNTNHLEKVSDGIKSRMLTVDFNASDQEEIKFLKREMYLRICNTICPSENIQITKNNLVSIINESFPDFRSILNKLQYFAQTGEISTHIINNDIKEELFNLIDDGSKNYEDVQKFIISKFGQDNIKQLLKIMSNDYTTWYIKNKNTRVNDLFYINNLVAESVMRLEHSVDPLIVAMSLIGNIRNLAK